MTDWFYLRRQDRYQKLVTQAGQNLGLGVPQDVIVLLVEVEVFQDIIREEVVLELEVDREVEHVLENEVVLFIKKPRKFRIKNMIVSATVKVEEITREVLVERENTVDRLHHNTNIIGLHLTLIELLLNHLVIPLTFIKIWNIEVRIEKEGIEDQVKKKVIKLLIKGRGDTEGLIKVDIEDLKEVIEGRKEVTEDLLKTQQVLVEKEDIEDHPKKDIEGRQIKEIAVIEKADTKVLKEDIEDPTIRNTRVLRKRKKDTLDLVRQESEADHQVVRDQDHPIIPEEEANLPKVIKDLLNTEDIVGLRIIKKEVGLRVTEDIILEGAGLLKDTEGNISAVGPGNLDVEAEDRIRVEMDLKSCPQWSLKCILTHSFGYQIRDLFPGVLCPICLIHPE